MSRLQSTAMWMALAMVMVGMSLSASAQFMHEPDNKLVPPPGLENVGIDQKLDAQIPLQLEFVDENGKSVKLADYFHAGRPVILTMVYYECPMLCGEVLNGTSAALKILKFTPGKEYEVVTVSVNPNEGPQLAMAKKQAYMKRLGKHGAEEGWHFLTGKKPDVDALANSIGWHYQYDERTKQYAHAAGIVVVTPEGRVAQYYYGIEYSAKDLRLGLVEASQNKIGSVVDQLLLYCYHYDPKTGKYGAVVTNVVRAAGGVTVLLLGGFLVMMFRREDYALHSSRQDGRN